MSEKINLILDSGAFSAWSQGASIDIDKYCQFALENINIIDYVVNLDVIPGKFGQKNLPKTEIERSASQGYENYYYLLNKGIPKEKLIHVFHQGENFRWLDKMVSEIEYIGVSPANDRTTPEKLAWLDLCMDHVLDKNGFPKVKFHGFAVTSLRIMMRYPWYSVDSTSWIMTSRMGSVYIPRYKNGTWIYDEDSWKIVLSSRSPSKQEEGKHFDNLPSEIQNVIQNYFEEKGYKLGKSEFKIETKDYQLKENEKWLGKAIGNEREVEVIIEEGLCNSYKQRDELNILYFLDLEKTFPKWPWAFKKKKANFGLL